MPSYKSTYEPREDSTLLQKYVRQYAKGSVLDIGTGSGIQAIAAAHSSKVKSVIATDILEETIDNCKKSIKNKKITFLASDLFKLLKNERWKNKKFDTIIFNPPYLPSELKIKDLTVEGGKKGFEVIERFLNDANEFLKPDGIILIVFSSLTKKGKVDEFIKNNLLEFKLLEKQHYFFEDLYVYLIKKSSILKRLEKNGINGVKYFSKGKRGFIFTAIYKNKKVAIKIKNPESEAIERINNEAKFLKILNKKNIGPKLLLLANNDFLAYGFVDGIPILEFLNANNKKSIIKIIKEILNQLYAMDRLQINKGEMSHPQKHILVSKNPVLIDFDRARYAVNPGNITQFCDFLISKNVMGMLKKKRININKKRLIGLAKEYKNSITKDNLNNIIGELR